MLFGTRIICVVGWLAIGFAAGAASALPTMTVDVLGGDPAQEVTGNGLFSGPDADGNSFWALDESQSITEGGIEVGFLNSFTVVFREDSTVSNNVSITNTTATDQVYEVEVQLPIPVTNYDSVRASSVGVSVTDSDGNGSLRLDDSVFSLFQGQVNGSTVLSLDPGLPLTADDCAPIANQRGCTATAVDNIGSLATPADAATNIGIVLRFALSPGDSVAVTSRFQISHNAAAASSSTLGGPNRFDPTPEAGDAWQPEAEIVILDGSSARQQGAPPEEGGAFAAGTAAPGVDPFTTNNIVVTNTNDFAVIYIVSTTLQIPAFDYGAVVASSVGASLTDSNGNTTLLADQNGTPFYRGRVGSATKLELDPVTPLTAADCEPFPNQPGCSAAGSDGTGSQPATGTANDLEIKLRFVLSPGDTIGITSRFELPEPSTLWQQACALGMLAFLARRRAQRS